MDIAAANGHWVILQNIHLVKSWLLSLEKKMEQLMEEPHLDYRLFMSAEPSLDPHESIIPQVKIQNIKKTKKNLLLLW